MLVWEKADFLPSCIVFPENFIDYGENQLPAYKKTPDRMKYVIATPGGTVRYDVPVMKVQAYTLGEIFV